MNHLKLFQIMSKLTKLTKNATNQLVQINLLNSIYRSKNISNDLAKFQNNMSDKINSEPSNSNYLKSKFNELVIWYEELSGMDEVRIAQKRVIDAQDRLILAQEQRREASKQLAVLHNKLKEVYSDLDTTTRGEERYLQLITKEHKLLREEKRLVDEFNLSEQEERNSFTVLSSTVKDSHEKERAQAEKTKYWSLIGSIIGTVIGVVGSSINNEFKMKELRKMIRETAESRPIISDLSDSTSIILNKLEKHLENKTNDKTPIVTNSTSTVDDLEKILQQQRYENKVFIASAVILGIFIPIAVSLVNR